MSLAAADRVPLRLLARHEGARVTALRVDNRRPRAAQLLVGRDLAQAVALVPSLFSLCGRAQAAAARLACAAAARQAIGADAEAGRVERTIVAEAASEHLWRLMLDWPALFGLEPLRRRYAELHRRLARPLDEGEAAAAGSEIRTLLEKELLPGLTTIEREPCAPGELIDALCCGGVLGTVFARLLADDSRSAECAVGPLLPALSATEWASAWQSGNDVPVVCAGAVAACDALRPPVGGFCATPSLDGRPAETGALARQSAVAVVRMLVDAGRTLMARMVAKVLEVADCARRLCGAPAGGRVLADACSPAPGVGLARVDCARGVLLHRVEVDGGRVVRYGICAPTEWNFHPQGAFVREGMAIAGDVETLFRRLTILALALDPCVEYKVVVEAANA